MKTKFYGTSVIEGWHKNSIFLSDDDSPVYLFGDLALDENKSVDEFCVLPYGKGSLSKNGVIYDYEFNESDVDQIIENHKRKGIDIPIDCEHHIYKEALKQGLTESEYLEKLPSEKPAAGFAKLSKREDGLWATVTSWTDRAKTLLQEGAYRHFSPVIRGIQSGNRSVTSIALTNEPALDQQDRLVLTEFSAGQTNNGRKGEDTPVKKSLLIVLINGIRKMLNQTPLALSEGDEFTESDTKVVNEFLTNTDLSSVIDQEAVKALTVQAGFLPKAREAMALSDDATADQVEGRMVALQEGAKNNDVVALTETINGLQKQIHDKERKEIYGRLSADGKMVEAQIPMMDKMDIAVLQEYEKSAQVIVQIGEANVKLPKDTKTLDNDALDLSEGNTLVDDIAKICGIDPDLVRGIKKEESK